jgi:ribosome-binding protein aMBF1 (putative translation factor)
MDFEICRKCGRNAASPSTVVEGVKLTLCTECIGKIKAEIALPPDQPSLELKPSLA